MLSNCSEAAKARDEFGTANGFLAVPEFHVARPSWPCFHGLEARATTGTASHFTRQKWWQSPQFHGSSQPVVIFSRLS